VGHGVLIMRLLVPLFAWSLLWLPLAGGAQIAAETAPAIPKTSLGLADSEPRWVDLSESQKSALTPLIEIWPALIAIKQKMQNKSWGKTKQYKSH